MTSYLCNRCDQMHEAASEEARACREAHRAREHSRFSQLREEREAGTPERQTAPARRQKRRPVNLQWCDAIAERELLTRAKVVGFVMATKYADWHDLGDIRPGNERLQRDTGLSGRTVRRGIQDLIEAGPLRVQRKGGYGNTAVTYQGMIPSREGGH